MDYAFNQWEKVRRRESRSCINLLSDGVFIITVILYSCPQDWLYPHPQAHGFSSHLFYFSNIRTEVGVYHRSVLGMWEEGGKKREFKITSVCTVKEHFFEWTSLLKKYTSSLSHWVSVLSLNETQSDTERRYNLWKYWDMLFQNEQNEWGISKNLPALSFLKWIRESKTWASICLHLFKWICWVNNKMTRSIFQIVFFGFII